MVLDRLMSGSLGRPCAIQEEEYVLSPPLGNLLREFTILC